DLLDYMKSKYRLVLLTADETKWLNSKNRSGLAADRIGDAKIAVYGLGVDGGPEMVSVSTSTIDSK
ncbi:hypothetical protein KC217_21750, partial [Mycobacterium tuberculosis]|nr:hypothetical protein [Mycobacterium tuberculosis]